MRSLFLSLFSFLVTAAALPAGPGETALTALKLLPQEAIANLTSIQGWEGTPFPERWHFLVFDPKVESGVHEYVVAGGILVGSWQLSQFAEELKAEDVVGAEAVKFDTDRVLKVAQKYALANGVTIVTYNYELKKDGNEARWHLTCLDETSTQLGRLVLTAGKGTLVSREGFPAEPPSETTKADKPDRSESTSRTAKAEKPRSQRSETRRAETEVRRAEAVRPAEPAPEPEPRRGLIRRVFGGGREPAPAPAPAPQPFRP